MDFKPASHTKMLHSKTTQHCFLLLYQKNPVLFWFYAKSWKTHLKIQRSQQQTQDVSSYSCVLDFLIQCKTFSSSISHELSSGFPSDPLALRQIFPPRSTVSLMKVLDQIACFLSLQSFCFKRNTGPEQSLAPLCCLRKPFSSGWLWVHASRTPPNKEHMCLFNVKQTRGWKSPSSCLSAASRHAEGHEECLWVRLEGRAGAYYCLPAH